MKSIKLPGCYKVKQLALFVATSLSLELVLMASFPKVFSGEPKNGLVIYAYYLQQ